MYSICWAYILSSHKRIYSTYLVEISNLHESIIKVIALDITKWKYRPLWQRRTHSYHFTDIKPTLDSGIWFGKSIARMFFIQLYLNHAISRLYWDTTTTEKAMTTYMQGIGRYFRNTLYAYLMPMVDWLLISQSSGFSGEP